MSFEGTVINGVIVLDGGEQLPEGARIKVVVTPSTPNEQATLQSFEELAGDFDDLPPDFAAEHNHYLHGTPRNKPEIG